LCYVPNSEHSLRDTDAIDTLVAFHYSIVHNISRPQLRWEYPSANEVRVKPSVVPRKATLWVATNPMTRDFRVDVAGRNYQPHPLEPNEEGVYTATVATPEEGWAAYFVQFEFHVGAPSP